MFNISKTTKGIYKKPIANIILTGEKVNTFPPRLGIKQGYILLPLLLKIVLDVLFSIVRQDKEIKCAHIERKK